MSTYIGKVLIVEDEPHIAHFLRHRLSNLGFDVENAYSGREALETSDSFDPDAVVLDLELPDVSGLSICDRLRDRSPRAGKRRNKRGIVIVSAHIQDEETLPGSVEADACFPKPISTQILASSIQELISEPGE